MTQLNFDAESEFISKNSAIFTRFGFKSCVQKYFGLEKGHVHEETFKNQKN